MLLEKIFELIRKEDVVLWVGSGFSMYAGYPGGVKLAETIYESLSSGEKQEVSKHLSLIDLTEQHVRFKSGSRNPLNSVIRNIYTKSPASIRWHEVLSNIPHIKTIVTTNYDRLFELAYKDEIHPIIFPADIAYRSDKTELYKVHGDINHLDTLILTRTDYSEFVRKNTAENLIWTAVKERISCKSVVFIGYDLEDENVKIILKDITDALGANRKEIFLIAPNLSTHKVNYLASMGIQYLNFKGEVFVEKLLENIKDRISDDFSKGYLSADTLRKFFTKNGLSVELKTINDKFSIQSVEGLHQTPTGNLTLNFKKDNEFMKSFREFAAGKRFGRVVMDESNLEKFSMKLNDVNILEDELSNYQIILYAAPQQKGTATIIFNDGSEFENIKYELFQSKELTELKATYRKSTFAFTFDRRNIHSFSNAVTANFTFTQSDCFDNVNDAIAVHKLAINLSKGRPMTLYISGQDKGYPLTPQETNFPILESLEARLDFFLTLKQVEQLYQVRFTKLGDYSKEDFHHTYQAVKMANGGVHIQHWDEELSWDLNKGTYSGLISKIQEGGHLVVKSQKLEELNIYQQNITLGYMIAEPQELYIVNLEQVMNKETSTLKVRSKSKTIKIFYKKKLETAAE